MSARNSLRESPRGRGGGEEGSSARTMVNDDLTVEGGLGYSFQRRSSTLEVESDGEGDLRFSGNSDLGKKAGEAGKEGEAGSASR